MRVHYNIDRLPKFRNAVITIGTFDGVHKGHQRILQKLKEEAEQVNGETVIITFHPHPRRVVAATQDLQLLNTLEEKIKLLDEAGIDHLVVTPFTETFSSQSAEEYIAHFLVDRFHPHTIIIGYDHRFGKNRSGDYRLLEKCAPLYNFQLTEIPRQVLDEIAVSSTRIRKALLDGEIDIADRLLGYNFFFEGKVVHGDKIGRQLGYPTANIQITDPEKIIPCNGIYAVYASVISTDAKNTSNKLKGMMSIGIRPTVGGTKRVIEVNLFDFNEDIYDRTVRVYLKKYLRPEVKFESLELLVRQIDQDKKDSLTYL